LDQRAIHDKSSQDRLVGWMTGLTPKSIGDGARAAKNPGPPALDDCRILPFPDPSIAYVCWQPERLVPEGLTDPTRVGSDLHHATPIQNENALDSRLPSDGQDDALDLGRIVCQHGVLQRRPDGVGQVGSRVGGVPQELGALIADKDEEGHSDCDGKDERHCPQDF
jgi:hypothetical protein